MPLLQQLMLRKKQLMLPRNQLMLPRNQLMLPKMQLKRLLRSNLALHGQTALFAQQTRTKSHLRVAFLLATYFVWRVWLLRARGCFLMEGSHIRNCKSPWIQGA